MSEATPDGPLPAYRALRRADDIAPDPAQKLAVEKLQALHVKLKQYQPKSDDAGWLGIFTRRARRREPTPQGLYIYGDVGRGKSMVMDLFFDTVPIERKRRVHFHAFMLEVHAAAHEFRQTPKDQRDGDDPIAPIAARIAAEAILLCFDEFQVQDVADAMILGRLFSALFDHGVVVVATSNRPPDDLYIGGLNRELFLPFIELFKERLDLLHLNGPKDHRMARLTGMPVYHVPADEQAAAALEDAFATLTQGADIAAAEIEVQARRLTISRAGAGVAWASFAELCGQPLGAADYLALAENFHTLVLSGIPKMGVQQRNEAKRFVTLIDALYEQKVKLICSAGAAPDELYPAGDGSFEFARTASRLIEMQSRDYLAQPHILR
ncbi:MAG: AFG1 family ATPase [Minwuiales bacterium]|nr:AFG1 family ATPase [Minwuiales bacterium]